MNPIIKNILIAQFEDIMGCHPSAWCGRESVILDENGRVCFPHPLGWEHSRRPLIIYSNKTDDIHFVFTGFNDGVIRFVSDQRIVDVSKPDDVTVIADTREEDVFNPRVYVGSLYRKEYSYRKSSSPLFFTRNTNDDRGITRLSIDDYNIAIGSQVEPVAFASAVIPVIREAK